MGISLIIDNREKIKEAALGLENSSVAALELGDYVFRNGTEDVLVVERKTLADFAASITDGRHREQKSRLLGVYPSSLVVYIVEGDLLNAAKALSYSRVGPDVLVSAMLNTMMRDGIHVIRTAGPEETVYILSCLRKKLEKGHSTKTTHSQDLVASSVRSCKSANMTPEIAFQMMLACVPSVSVTTAERISLSYPTMCEFVDAVRAADAPLGFIQNLKAGKAGSRKISKKAVENILLFLGL